MILCIRLNAKWLRKKRLPITSGFTQAGVYARRQFCTEMNVCTPQEVQWKPPPREAAGTLYASGGQLGEVIKRIFDFVWVDNSARNLAAFDFAQFVNFVKKEYVNKL